MPSYRFYQIGPGGHIFGPPHNIEVPDDDAALLEGEKLVDGHDIEIWEGPRKVAYVRKTRK